MFENTKDIVVNGAKAGRQVSGRSHSLTHLQRVKHTHLHMSVFYPAQVEYLSRRLTHLHTYIHDTAPHIQSQDHTDTLRGKHTMVQHHQQTFVTTHAR